MMQVAVIAAPKQRKHLWRGMVPPEKLRCFARLVRLL
jgi:hypothetical protein